MENQKELADILTMENVSQTEPSLPSYTHAQFQPSSTTKLFEHCPYTYERELELFDRKSRVHDARAESVSLQRCDTKNATSEPVRTCCQLFGKHKNTVDTLDCASCRKKSPFSMVR